MEKFRLNGKLIKTALISLFVLIIGISAAFAVAPLFSSNVRVDGNIKVQL